jgi:hypothetical protein
MGPEDRHEEPAEQDGYEKWLEEVTRKRETAELAKLIKPEYSQASELDADEWDAEWRKGK